MQKVIYVGYDPRKNAQLIQAWADRATSYRALEIGFGHYSSINDWVEAFSKMSDGDKDNIAAIIIDERQKNFSPSPDVSDPHNITARFPDDEQIQRGAELCHFILKEQDWENSKGAPRAIFIATSYDYIDEYPKLIEVGGEEAITFIDYNPEHIKARFCPAIAAAIYNRLGVQPPSAGAIVGKG